MAKSGSVASKVTPFITTKGNAPAGSGAYSNTSGDPVAKMMDTMPRAGSPMPPAPGNPPIDASDFKRAK